MALSPKKIASILFLILAILCDSTLAQRVPRKKRGEGRRKLLRRAAMESDSKLFWKADLSLKRLLFAQAVSDADRSISELDNALTILETTRTWIESQGPFWNNEKTKAVLVNVEEALKFIELRLQAEFGLVGDLDERLSHFLKQDYPPEQKIAVLLFATESQSDRGQLQQANNNFKKALELATARKVSPVLRYALITQRIKLQFLGGQPLTEGQLLQGFDKAHLSLKDYQPKQRPLQDIHWLVARNITPFWAVQLGKMGPEGVPRLQQLLTTLQNLKRESKTPWDDNQLRQQGIVFPYDGYIKVFADAILISSLTDQIIGVVEALPAEARQKALPKSELDALAQFFQGLSAWEFLLNNKELGPEYTDYVIGESGLVPELEGRVRVLSAAFATKESAQVALLQEGWQYIWKSDDLPKKLGYGISISDQLFSEFDSPETASPILLQTLKEAQSSALPQVTISALASLAKQNAHLENWEKAGEYANRCLQQIEEAIPLTGGSSRLAYELQKLSSAMTSIAAQSALTKNDATAALSVLTQGQNYESAVSQLGANKKASEDLKNVKEKKQQVAILTQKVDQLKALPSSGTRDELLADSEQLLAATRSAFLLESRKIRQKHSDLYSSVLKFDPLNLPDIQSSLSSDTTVIQYFPTENELFLFVVTNKTLKLRSVKIKKTDLELQCQDFTRSLSRFAKMSTVISQSQVLYKSLIAPLEEDLVSAKRLIIIPSGSLNFIPYGALYDSNDLPLIKKYSFLELAKPTDFIKIAQSKPVAVTNVTAFANATLDLPATSDEGQEIVKLFDSSKLFEGKEATKERFLAQSDKHQALHLATHGHWDTADSLKNYLELANGERVAQEEILSLALQRTALVTLSACNTAVSDSKESDYVASLAEAFWLAGCPTVVASLWAVEDESTGLLMMNFYSGLKDGKSKVAALRDAQLEVLNNESFKHPTFWSGFVLFGDWR